MVQGENCNFQSLLLLLFRSATGQLFSRTRDIPISILAIFLRIRQFAPNNNYLTQKRTEKKNWEQVVVEQWLLHSILWNGFFSLPVSFPWFYTELCQWTLSLPFANSVSSTATSFTTIAWPLLFQNSRMGFSAKMGTSSFSLVFRFLIWVYSSLSLFSFYEYVANTKGLA